MQAFTVITINKRVCLRSLHLFLFKSAGGRVASKLEYCAGHHKLPKYSLKCPRVTEICAVVNCIPYYGKFCVESDSRFRIVASCTLHKIWQWKHTTWFWPMGSHDYSHVNWPKRKLRAVTCVDTRVTINKMAVDTEQKISTADFRVVPLFVSTLKSFGRNISSW